MRVVSLDQLPLPSPPPLLDLLLAFQRGLSLLMRLVPNKLVHAVAQRETGNDFVLMLPDTLEQVGCEADIERAVRLARQNVDEKHRAGGEVDPGFRRDGVVATPPAQRCSCGSSCRPPATNAPCRWCPRRGSPRPPR